MSKYKLSETDLRRLADLLDTNYDELSGDSMEESVEKLVEIAIDKRNGDVVQEILGSRTRPSYGSVSSYKFLSDYAKKLDIERPANALNDELKNLEYQVKELKSQSISNDIIEQKLQEVSEGIDRALNKSNEITARVRLPRQEAMDVQLVPSHSLDRLEEYNADLNWAFLFTGAFIGGTLGILSNWATNEEFVVTRISSVLIVLFVGLTVVGLIWAIRLRKRMSDLKHHIFAQNLPEPIAVENTQEISKTP